MECYQRGEEHTLYVNFLTLENKEATTIVDPKLTIRHIDASNNVITDVLEATLVYAIETMYYYKWDVPADADLTEYTIEYEATVDGEYAETNETIRLIDSSTGTPSILYTTKAKVADYLGVDASNIKDDWLEWATYYIDIYCNCVFRETTIVEKKDIREKGQSILFLDHFPVISVAEVKNDGEVMDTADYLIYDEEGIIKLADDFIGNIYNVGAFVYGRQKVEVTYNYGRTSVPDEIEWATTVIVANIAYQSLVTQGVIRFGNVTEEEIGEYRYKESSEAGSVEKVYEGQKIADRLEEDVLSVKNVLRIYRTRKVRAV